jgi:hypothetical protein
MIQIPSRLTDEERLDSAVRSGEKAILMRCFNKEEADRLVKFMSERHPEIKFQVTWLEFK